MINRDIKVVIVYHRILLQLKNIIIVNFCEKRAGGVKESDPVLRPIDEGRVDLRSLETNFEEVNMSSHARVGARVKKVTMHHINIKGGQVIALNELLGDGGKMRLKETLNALPQIREKIIDLKPHSIQAQMLDWKETSTPDCYQLMLRGNALSLQELQGKSLRVELRLGEAAELRHECNYETRGLSQEQQQMVQQAAQLTATRSFNQLLSTAVAQHISEQLQKYSHVVKERVHMKAMNQLNVENRFTIQAYGMVAGSPGR
jgi:hypothetical protein